jgi:addiction module HigA family antidote
MLQPRRPIAVHPGEILQELLEQNQITQSVLARHLHVTQAKINEICRGKRGITPDMAMKLGKAFDQSASFWLNLQKNWELSQLDEADYVDITPIQLPA